MSSFEGSKKSRPIPALSVPLELLWERRTKEKPDRAPIEMARGDRDWIVRGFNEKTLPTIGKEEPDGTFMERALAISRLFAELEEKYGIPVPAHFFMGEDEEKRPTLFIMTEKVEGVDFNELTNEEKEGFRMEDEKTLRALLTYYKDKFNSGEEFLVDVGNTGQYMYGTLKGEDVPRLYLVDTDPYLATRTSPLRHKMLNVGVDDILNSLAYLEKQHATDMTTLHDEAVDFYNKLTNPNIEKPT
jgi:hypothetical protein